MFFIFFCESKNSNSSILFLGFKYSNIILVREFELKENFSLGLGNLSIVLTSSIQQQ
tara:strand:- start:275 stop:445 length:171 start_codon:yes stop_codon:yes gene_type:complete